MTPPTNKTTTPTNPRPIPILITILLLTLPLTLRPTDPPTTTQPPTQTTQNHTPQPPPQQTQPPGHQLYQQHCARCHGKNGQGTPDHYDEPLHGDRSIPSLARLIQRTMPEDKPKTLTPQTAQQIAQYIHPTFYSPAARQRQQPPPRLQLTRLTINQHRNTLADLITPLPQPDTQKPDQPNQPDQPAPPQPGLQARYYQSEGMNKANQLKHTHTDKTIQHNYQQTSPHPDITPDQFAIIWTGALHPPTTGNYQFRITTPNGARLYLNTQNTGKRHKMRDDSSQPGQTPLIDAWVTTGKNRQTTARQYLLGGRPYPIRLEYFKYKEKTANIHLQWKPPHTPWQTLNHHHTTTANPPRTYTPPTPFPPDDRSRGYETGAAITPAWHRAANQAALHAVDEIIQHLPRLAHIQPNDPQRQTKTKNLITHYATRAYRRPLTPQETQLLTHTLHQNTPNPETAHRRALLLILTNPNYLYIQPPQPNTPPTQHQIAQNIALTLWDTLPDHTLRHAANNNQLQTPQQIQTQIQRMLHHPKTHAKIQNFTRQWLQIDQHHLNKNPKTNPHFNPQTITDLRHSLQHFIHQTIWTPPSDYRQLHLANHLYLNQNLLPHYAPNHTQPNQPTQTKNPNPTNPEPTQTTEPQNQNQTPETKTQPHNQTTKPTNPETNPEPTNQTPDQTPPTTNPDQNQPTQTTQTTDNQPNQNPHQTTDPTNPDPNHFTPIPLPAQRAGLLTHPYLLSALAYHDTTSPIHRGVFLTRNILGRHLKPPPEAVAFNNADYPTNLTMRQKITRLTADTPCMTCHQIINPLGFALENYDTTGRWRTTENNQPIDTQTQYTDPQDTTHTIHTPHDLAHLAAHHPDAQRTFITHLFRHLTKHPPNAYQPNTLQKLHLHFQQNNYNIQKLITQITYTAATHQPTTTTPNQTTTP